MKHHPHFARLLQGGRRIGYGARALNEGGLQSVPRLTMPGALFIGCASGFLNVPKVKGVHNAIRSGRLAAEATFADLSKVTSDASTDGQLEVMQYSQMLKASPVWRELHQARNVRPSFGALRAGLAGMMLYTGTVWYALRGREPWTFSHGGGEFYCSHDEAIGDDDYHDTGAYELRPVTITI